MTPEQKRKALAIADQNYKSFLDPDKRAGFLKGVQVGIKLEQDEMKKYCIDQNASVGGRAGAIYFIPLGSSK